MGKKKKGEKKEKRVMEALTSSKIVALGYWFKIKIFQNNIIKPF